MTLVFIQPNWSAPKNVHACTTTRSGGVSAAPFDSFNIATHVNDNIDHVKKNRAQLKKTLQLPNEPIWLDQVHGNLVIDPANRQSLTADGIYTDQKNLVCVIQTADCLPILLCNKTGTEIAALHGGWRSLSKNIIQEGIAKFHSLPSDITVWLGPAIGPNQFEVGNEVREIFCTLDNHLKTVFKSLPNNRWLMNIYKTAEIFLQHCGVTNIYYDYYCTYSDPKHFYSYRRNHVTGRMATLIWME